MTSVVIIFAKVGSLGLPGKNTWVVRGKSLLEWTIEDASKNKLVERIYVSTNGEEVARIAARCGARVIKRPDELAKNENFLFAVDHAVTQVKAECRDLEVIAIPQCVVPFRDPDIFDRCIRFLLEHPEYDSAVTIRPTPCIPEAIMRMTAEEEMRPYFPQAQVSTLSTARQDSPGYEIDHAVEAFRYRSWLDRADGVKPFVYLGKKIKGIRQNFHNPNCFVDVHTLNDIRWLEFLVERLGYKGMQSCDEQERH